MGAAGAGRARVPQRLRRRGPAGDAAHGALPFKADQVLGRGDNVLIESPDAFDIDELRLQLINELVEMDLIDLRFADKTHMVDIPKKFSKKVEQAEWQRLHKVALFLQKKTIWTEIPNIDESNMITQSSWYYRTPTLSPDQLEYIEIMQSTKYQFVEDHPKQELHLRGFYQELPLMLSQEFALRR